MLTQFDLRQKFAAFWEKQNHKLVPPIPLVPQNDPTTLFTGSGMQQFVPYLLGQPHPQGTRLFNIQRCCRLQDMEEVGDNRHDTCFEMMGNWSLGDYFKREQLEWCFDFFVNELKLDPNRMYVTVFGGSEEIPADQLSITIWEEIFAKAGLKTEVGTAETFHPTQRITTYDAHKNWWSRAGVPALMPPGEPGGPDSEVFYDLNPEGPAECEFGHCHVNCDCGRFIEIANNVFMQYKKTEGGFAELEKPNVDVGYGFERVLMAAQNKNDVFETDIFKPIMEAIISQKSKVKSQKIIVIPQPSSVISTEVEKSQKKEVLIDSSTIARNDSGNEDATSYKLQVTRCARIVADHIRSAVLLVADGVNPGPNEQGYFLRRLIRRAVRFASKIGVSEELLDKAVDAAIKIYKDIYPQVTEVRVKETILAEVVRFEASVARAIPEVKKRFAKIKNSGIPLKGSEIFDLYQSLGIPTEEVIEMANEEKLAIDMADFTAVQKEHQDKSRAGAEKKFKGGLADQSEQTIKYHTATHLLQQALTDVLGRQIRQEGSNITGERFRFDFPCDHKPTEDELKEVEQIVNQKITEELPVTPVPMRKEDAMALGARSFFREKYPDIVNVYFIGKYDPLRRMLHGKTQEGHEFKSINPEHHINTQDFYSLEFCGGPHVKNTKEIGTIEIFKCEKIGASLYRVYAK